MKLKKYTAGKKGAYGNKAELLTTEVKSPRVMFVPDHIEISVSTFQ